MDIKYLQTVQCFDGKHSACSGESFNAAARSGAELAVFYITGNVCKFIG